MTHVAHAIDVIAHAIIELTKAKYKLSCWVIIGAKIRSDSEKRFWDLLLFFVLITEPPFEIIIVSLPLLFVVC